MNSKSVAFSIVAVAAVIALFASGPLVAYAQAFPGFGGFHRGFGFGHGFGFHRGFGFHHFGFHRGFGFPGFGFGGFGGCGF